MQYTLGGMFKDGGEGEIYDVQGYPSLLAKLYKAVDANGNPIKTPELFEKLQYMKDNPPKLLVNQGSVAWPLDIYYKPGGIPDYADFMGIIMPRLDFDLHIDKAFVYRHPIIDRHDYKSYISAENRIKLAINICSVLAEIHAHGFIVGDFNHRNIGINKSDSTIVLMDCDSFDLSGILGDPYRCNVILPGYLAPEIIEHCELEERAGRSSNLDNVKLPTFTEQSDYFCLAILIFRLLMNGVHPYNGVNVNAYGSTAWPGTGNGPIKRNAYVFRQGLRAAAEFCLPKNALPPIIANFFDLAFAGIKKGASFNRPTAEMWYQALYSEYLNRLTQCSANSKHKYYNGLSYCPWCLADTRKQEKDSYGKPRTNYPTTPQRHAVLPTPAANPSPGTPVRSKRSTASLGNIVINPIRGTISIPIKTLIRGFQALVSWIRRNVKKAACFLMIIVLGFIAVSNMNNYDPLAHNYIEARGDDYRFRLSGRSTISVPFAVTERGHGWGIQTISFTMQYHDFSTGVTGDYVKLERNSVDSFFSYRLAGSKEIDLFTFLFDQGSEYVLKISVNGVEVYIVSLYA